MRKAYVLRPGVIALLLLVSCSKDEKDPTVPNPDTPFPATPPSPLTMQIETSHLQGDEPLGARLQRAICHDLSAAAVAWVEANLVIRLAIPSGAFHACLLREPAYLGDDTWRWTSNAGSGPDAHTDELTAHLPGGGQVEWSMRITGTRMQLDHFLWFDGACDATAQSGSWRFYDPAEPQSQIERIRIEWSFQGAGDRELTIENREAEGAGWRDRLRFDLEVPEASLVFIDADTAGVDTTDIAWDTVIGSGRTVRAGGDTCCWGPEVDDYPDILCP